MSGENQLILVLDFGGQYKELIARAVRSQSVYSKIKAGDISAEEVRALAPIGIILTGGPNSVFADDAPLADPAIYDLGIPVLGICYGMQMICHQLGGTVSEAEVGEYGVVALKVQPCANLGAASVLFAQAPHAFAALMSHRDKITQVPAGFGITASTDQCPIAAFEDPARRLYGTQFHPETNHTEAGQQIFRSFLFDVCGATGDYKLDDYLQQQVAAIRAQVGTGKVLLALSGGVDSSVCAALLSRAITGQLTCIFVDHGFMRKDEGDQIEAIFANQDLHFIRVNAKDRFLAKIAGVTEPEAKRKVIGEEFIRVFEEEAAKLDGIRFLAQGTIYPDVVESGGAHGATIKSHHNVGGLPEDLDFDHIIEPLAGLFKDEVRALATKLGLPDLLTNRQPFPGPGLALRVIGEVTETKLDTLREVDAIVREVLDNYSPRPDQYFAVLTNTDSVGVKGDDRTYGPVVAFRAVNTDDFMTANYAPLNHETINHIATRITAEVATISRVVYDVSSKPPATVEWE